MPRGGNRTSGEHRGRPAPATVKRERGARVETTESSGTARETTAVVPALHANSGRVVCGLAPGDA